MKKKHQKKSSITGNYGGLVSGLPVYYQK